MKCFFNTTEFGMPEKTAVTLGKFDGVHRGHQKLIQTVCGAEDMSSVVFTFASSPGAVLTGTRQSVLTTADEKRCILESMGVDYLIEYPFNAAISHLAPEAFVRHVLVDQLNVGLVVTGNDFRFGYKRAGDTALLADLGARLGFRVEVMEKEKEGGRDISSSRIKEEMADGHLEEASKLLGRPYRIKEKVVHGIALARTLGIPTLNMIPSKEKMLPPNGVYATRTWIHGRVFEGITNIGTKPTVTEKKTVVAETHLFHYHEDDLYDQILDIDLYHFIRPEIRFDSVTHLKEQMERDIETSKKYFGCMRGIAQ